VSVSNFSNYKGHIPSDKLTVTKPTNDFFGVLWTFSKGERSKVTFKNLKNRHHSWIGHTVRHNESVVNILEGAISRKKTFGNPGLQY